MSTAAVFTDQDRIKAIHHRCREVVDRMLIEYGATRDNLEIRHWEKLDAILDAETPKQAAELSERAQTSIHTTVLFLLSKGKILGRNPTEAYEKKARKTESFIPSYLREAESKFNSPAEQERFRKKAETARAKADELWKLAGKEPPKPGELTLTEEERAEAEKEVLKMKAEKKDKKPTPAGNSPLPKPRKSGKGKKSK
jgi:hypothetical protein